MVQVPPWEAAAAAQTTHLEKEAVRMLWRKWRSDSRSVDGKVDYTEFLSLTNTIKTKWERMEGSDSDTDSEDEEKEATEPHEAAKVHSKKIRFLNMAASFRKKWESQDRDDKDNKLTEEKTDETIREDSKGEGELTQETKDVENTEEGATIAEDDAEIQQLFNLLDRDEDDFLEFPDLLAFLFSLR